MNVDYKFLFKCLANRLAILLSELLPKNQCTFVKVRSIADNSALSEEHQCSFNQTSTPRRASKCVDLQKTFDIIHQGGIGNVLKAMDFALTFINLIMDCITTASFSILVEGHSTNKFSRCRGLRQRDPLSLLLFNMVLEVLSLEFHIAEWKGEFDTFIIKGMKSITHLIFADDLLVFTKANRKSLYMVKRIPDKFAAFSGLVTNHDKSAIYYSRSMTN